MFSIVAATDRTGGIGKNGNLPWPKLNGDMKFYRELTSCPSREAVELRYGLREESDSFDFESYKAFRKYLDASAPPTAPDKRRPNAVIMGRKTWDSLPPTFRPLPDRRNVVLSRNGLVGRIEGMLECDSLDAALNQLADKAVPNVFVVGGSEVFAAALRHEQCRRIYLTRIESAFDCNVFFPQFGDDFAERSRGHAITEHGMQYQFKVFERLSAVGNRLSRAISNRQPFLNPDSSRRPRTSASTGLDTEADVSSRRGAKTI